MKDYFVAANGLTPETSVGPDAASAIPATTNAADAALVAMIQRETRMPYLLGAWDNKA